VGSGKGEEASLTMRRGGGGVKCRTRRKGVVSVGRFATVNVDGELRRAGTLVPSSLFFFFCCAQEREIVARIRDQTGDGEVEVWMKKGRDRPPPSAILNSSVQSG
jgi:hypothetical protein